MTYRERRIIRTRQFKEIGIINDGDVMRKVFKCETQYFIRVKKYYILLKRELIGKIILNEGVEHEKKPIV